MVTESEANIEKKFIERLEENGYSYIKLKDMGAVINNFRNQIEKFNDFELTDEEFKRLLIYLDAGSIFDKSKKLRDKFPVKRKDKPTKYLKFIDKEYWCKNLFQVSNQITVRSEKENRYDVTILINGLPLVQIELKKTGVELSQAFNQIERYYKNSYKGLFNYIQLFVISNNLCTKYFSNVNAISDFDYFQTFYWKHENNKNIYRLSEFTDTFMKQNNLVEMITKYMVLNDTEKKLMVLRAYQKYAVEAILKQALDYKQNGYVWHTTGSGKTVTSFKVSNLLANKKSVDKVIFVVDRNDLDDQTNEEFNKFSPGSINDIDNTNILVKKMLGEDKLIVTTIQKLNNAVKRKSKRLEKIKDNHIIFIYDECHRSQFGTQHDNIENYFLNSLSFGFTGTPIFEENKGPNDKVTASVFGTLLHSYLIKDAIADDNVLGFNVEYWKTAKVKDDIENEEVTDIDRKEVLEADTRIKLICDQIINSYDKITKHSEFNAMLTVSQGPVIHKYYKFLREKNPNLKIACIFTYGPNSDFDDNWMQDVDYVDYLKQYIKDYNKQFNTNFSIDTFEAYQKDISKKMKNRRLDLLLVKDMFLTGFDCKKLNTLYIDKKMKYHTLIQAFSRTNRLCGLNKDQGNIICFRNIREETKKAIKLFSKDAPVEEVLVQSYEYYVKEFNKAVKKLRELVSTVDDALYLEGETNKREFIVKFRNLLRIKNKLENFVKFSFDNLDMDEEEFNEFKTVYIEMRPKKNDKVSILNDIDFELELINNDKINVDFILKLIKDLDDSKPSYQGDIEYITTMTKENDKLRNKTELIIKFIDEVFGTVDKTKTNVEESFYNFMNQERRNAFCTLIEEENLKEDVIRKIIKDYEFTDKFDENLVDNSFVDGSLGLVERLNKRESVIDKIVSIFDKFEL